MFLGHYGIAFASKRLCPSVSLGTLFVAAQFIDLLWPVFLLLGWEHVRIEPGLIAMTPLDFYDYPITHSLLGCLGWAVLLGLLFRLLRGTARQSVVVSFVVLTHWALDAVVHRPDLPLHPWSDRLIGLGLWNRPSAAIAVEAVLFAAGVFLYLQGTRPVRRAGTWSLAILVGVLVGIAVANWTGPPPPSLEVLIGSAVGLWIFVPVAYAVDRRRRTAGVLSSLALLLAVGLPATALA